MRPLNHSGVFRRIDAEVFSLRRSSNPAFSAFSMFWDWAFAEMAITGMCSQAAFWAIFEGV
jgi:hypothetical protein